MKRYTHEGDDGDKCNPPKHVLCIHCGGMMALMTAPDREAWYLQCTERRNRHDAFVAAAIPAVMQAQLEVALRGGAAKTEADVADVAIEIADVVMAVLAKGARMTPTPDKDDEYAMRRARAVVVAAFGPGNCAGPIGRALVKAIAREITRASQPRPEAGEGEAPMTWQRRVGPALEAIAHRSDTLRYTMRLVLQERPRSASELVTRMAAAGYACGLRTVERHASNMVRDGILERDGHMYRLKRKTAQSED